MPSPFGMEIESYSMHCNEYKKRQYQNNCFLIYINMHNQQGSAHFTKGLDITLNIMKKLITIIHGPID